MSNSVRPHRRQPTRLPFPWDSPGKNTGVGCHFLLQCMKVKSESEVAHSCPTPSDPMDCSLPGSSAHGIFQVRVLEWDAIAFSSKALLIFSSSFVLFLKLNNFNFPFSSALVLLLSIQIWCLTPLENFQLQNPCFLFIIPISLLTCLIW